MLEKELGCSLCSRSAQVQLMNNYMTMMTALFTFVPMAATRTKREACPFDVNGGSLKCMLHQRYNLVKRIFDTNGHNV